MSAMHEALRAAGLPVERPLPSKTWRCLRGMSRELQKPNRAASLTAFGVQLRDYRESRGISQSRLARMAGLDHSYVSRLESGDREPSREAVEILAMVMQLRSVDTDALLMAAGYMPDDPASLLDAEPAVASLYALLGREDIPEATREAVRSQVALIVEQVASMTPDVTEAA